jgi:hypothetical protein
MGMILGIGVESGVGKDTFAMFVTDYLRSRKIKSLNIVREGFADRLYDVGFALYSWAGFKSRQHYVMNPGDKLIVLPKLGKTPKQILIDLSHAICAYDQNIFFNAVANDTNPFHLKIVPDVRRPVEFNALSANPSVYLLRITKTGVDSQWDMDQELKKPPYVDRWHEVINNETDLKAFNEKAIEFSERIILPRLYNIINGAA